MKTLLNVLFWIKELFAKPYGDKHVDEYLEKQRRAKLFRLPSPRISRYVYEELYAEDLTAE